MSFELHSRLAADTDFVCDWPLCRVLLMKDGRYFWLILVPRRENLTEITELSPQDRATLMEEAARRRACFGFCRLVVTGRERPFRLLNRHCFPFFPNRLQSACIITMTARQSRLRKIN